MPGVKARKGSAKEGEERNVTDDNDCDVRML